MGVPRDGQQYYVAETRIVTVQWSEFSPGICPENGMWFEVDKSGYFQVATIDPDGKNCTLLGPKNGDGS